MRFDEQVFACPDEPDPPEQVSGEQRRSPGKKREQSMAYLARIEPHDAQPVALPVANDAMLPKPDFSPLEWSVIRLARVDRLWTIRPAGRPRRFWNWLLGRGNPELANPKLEALRRIAVLTWHFGFTIPGEDVRDFLSAGFTLDQYELMARNITATLSAPRRIAA
jgi:hypothetical protein